MGLWIDTDMGVDDVMAVLMLADGAEVDGISLVFGCADLAQVRRNALDFLGTYGMDIPLFKGAGTALNGTCETAQRILGTSGQPSRGARFPRAADQALPPAMTGLSDWLTRAPGGEIVALGPLTNIAALILARPAMAARIGRVIWMGGSAARGNHTDFAEFNAFADPEALDALLAAQVPITMVELEACRDVTFGPGHLEAVPAQGVLRELIGGYLDIGLSRGRAGMALYDPVAAALVTRPELFGTSEIGIAVELHDPARRGQTLVDDEARGTDCRIIHQVDSDAIRDTILSAMRDPA